jgi:purine nucleosidase
MPYEKFIVDTDIGDDFDDAYALVYLSQEIRANTLGVTTVLKNALQRAKITAHLLKLLDWDIPVAAGESQPLKAKMMFLPFETPSDNPSISQYEEEFANEKILDQNAVDFILDQIKTNEKLTLICIGPLTNIALAIKKDPKTFKKINRILIMGGSFNTNYVEWNVKCDPEAFAIVLNSGVKLEMVGHDLTRDALLTQKDVDYLKKLNSPPLKFLEKITSNYLRYYNYTRLPCMHDPLAVSLLKYNFVKMKPMRVCAGMDADKKGLCIIDEKGVLVNVAYKANQFFFRKHLMRKLKQINKIHQ